MTVVAILGAVLIVLGALLLVATAVGVVRFPDFYTRLHAAGKGDTLGQGLVLAGLVLWAVAVGYSWVVILKLAVIVFFIFIFNPTATHALARGAWVAGLRPWFADDTDEGGGEGGSAVASPPSADDEVPEIELVDGEMTP